MEETTPRHNCGLMAEPWAYGGAPLLASRGKAMDLLRATFVQNLSAHLSQPDRTGGTCGSGAERFPRRKSQCSAPSICDSRSSAFPRHISAHRGRMYRFSPLLISHRVSCGLSHRTLGAARRHHWRHYFSPASWQSGGRNPNAEHRVWEPAQGVLGLGSQFSP